MSTERKLNDYLHFYLGCEFEYEVDAKRYRDIIKSVGTTVNAMFRPEEILILLRPLSDMTMDEWNEIGKKSRSGQNIRTAGDLWKMNAEETAYLISKGFDLFNLIPDGLAIDKTTLKP